MKKFLIIQILGASFFLILNGCTSLHPVSKKRSAEKIQIANNAFEDMNTEELAKDLERNPNSPTASDIEKLTIEEVIRIEEPNTQNLYDNSRYDFPITINSKVERWIDYFTGRGRPHMERYLGRSSRYIPIMRKIFKHAGLPEDLVYLALIESGFNLRANSKARAVGPWQFMKATGKRYGLRVDAWIDERRDPIKSTEAAARYLKDLYLIFESWYLAASGYNAGEYKILRAIENLKTNNFWRISESKQIRRETKDYIPKLIAAAIIAKNPARYGFEEVAYDDPLEFDTLTIDFAVNLKDIAKLVDTSEDELLDLNPELRRNIVPPHITSYELRVPAGSKTLVERAIQSIRTKFAKNELPAQYFAKHGDTLNSVANKFRLSKKDLANANNLSPKEKLNPGQELIIPNRKLAENKKTITRVHKETNLSDEDAKGFIIHIVRKGESLWSISEKYNVTVQELYKWNKLSNRKILPGNRIRVKSENTAPEV